MSEKLTKFLIYCVKNKIKIIVFVFVSYLILPSYKSALEQEIASIVKSESSLGFSALKNLPKGDFLCIYSPYQGPNYKDIISSSYKGVTQATLKDIPGNGEDKWNILVFKEGVLVENAKVRWRFIELYKDYTKPSCLYQRDARFSVRKKTDSDRVIFHFHN